MDSTNESGEGGVPPMNGFPPELMDGFVDDDTFDALDATDFDTMFRQFDPSTLPGTVLGDANSSSAHFSVTDASSAEMTASLSPIAAKNTSGNTPIKTLVLHAAQGDESFVSNIYSSLKKEAYLTPAIISSMQPDDWKDLQHKYPFAVRQRLQNSASTILAKENVGNAGPFTALIDPAVSLSAGTTPHQSSPTTHATCAGPGGLVLPAPAPAPFAASAQQHSLFAGMTQHQSGPTTHATCAGPGGLVLPAPAIDLPRPWESMKFIHAAVLIGCHIAHHQYTLCRRIVPSPVLSHE